MTAYDGIPQDSYFEDDEDREVYMEDVYLDLRKATKERHFHDRSGFFADTAGSAACEALGHVAPEDPADWGEVEGHSYSFDGDYLCVGTRFGECCTECEGECCEPDVLKMSTRAELWALVSAP